MPSLRIFEQKTQQTNQLESKCAWKRPKKKHQKQTKFSSRSLNSRSTNYTLFLFFVGIVVSRLSTDSINNKKCHTAHTCLRNNFKLKIIGMAKLNQKKIALVSPYSREANCVCVLADFSRFNEMTCACIRLRPTVKRRGEGRQSNEEKKRPNVWKNKGITWQLIHIP